MDKIHVKLLLVTALVATGSPQALAVEPASVDVGNLELTPVLSVSTGYTDNLFDDNSNEKSTWITKVRPSVTLQGVSEKLTAGIKLSADKVSYHSSSSDAYIDKSATAYADLELDSRKKLELLAEYLKRHDARSDSGSGSSFTTDQTSKPTRYTSTNLGVRFSYGTTQSTGQIVLGGRFSDKEYDNFRSLTRSKDRIAKEATAAFYYRVTPKTRILVEGRYTDYDYQLSSSTLDSVSKKAFVGVEWEASAKTTGTAKFGYANKNFDSNTRDDFSGNNWEVGLSWSPRTYSIFDLTSMHSTEESNGDADYIEETGFSLGWDHEWSERVSSLVSYTMLNEEYAGDPDGREDDTNTLRVGMDYDLRRWLSVGVSVSRADFNSNINNLDYTSNEILLTVQGSL